METWLLDQDMDDYDHRKNQPKVDYGPMGPNHPGWKFKCDEVAHQLSRAGRVIDQETIEFIAQDNKAWQELLIQVKANYPIIDAQIKAQIFSDFLSNVRTNAESDQRLENLFGGKTTTTEQNPF